MFESIHHKTATLPLRSVTSADVTLTQSKVGQAVNGSNFREDVDLDGAINSTDVNLVQSEVGTKLP
jgi:hypothetical protein